MQQHRALPAGGQTYDDRVGIERLGFDHTLTDRREQHAHTVGERW